MKDNNCDISFGDAIYYRNTPGGIVELVETVRYPQNCDIYLPTKFKSKTAILNYILLNDPTIGANFLVRTRVATSYLNLAIDAGIKFAEDMIYRSMLADGKVMNYFSSPVIWYEYGTGISTSGNDKWGKIIQNEKHYSNEMLIRQNMYRGLKKARFTASIRALDSISCLKYLIYPELIYWKIIKNTRMAHTIVDNLSIPSYLR